ncbi:cytochrome c1 [Paraferrimonas sedimenticola]|nr:cytochrome c1 [Paraferrimonas sedimenticola]
MKKLLIAIVALLPSLVLAAGGAPVPFKANIDLNDTESLQRGAKAFMESCFGCHSTHYQRYERVAQDLDIPVDVMRNELITTGAKIGELMENSIDDEDSAKWFGAAPPDLTLAARVRGEDWVYSYLKSFYKDETRPFGTNNTVFPLVGMPHVLEAYQGIPVLQEDGSIVATGGSMNAEEYDQLVKDITGFMVYSAEPMRLERERMGVWVLGFLVILFIFSYLLKKEYWKDVH